MDISPAHALMNELNQRPIVVYPVYKAVMGSYAGAVLLSQIMSYFDGSKKGKVSKTDAEIREETGLSGHQLRMNKKVLKELDFMAVTREGIPAKTHYEVDWKAYQTCLVNTLQTRKANIRKSSRLDILPAEQEDRSPDHGEGS